ncbi:MAG: hypothetical protein IPJ40_19660 [Saprospirales bacterium]|nr:hypothetical protein [Saprospirales bacterium]
MLTPDYLNHVGNLIGRDDIPGAIALLQKLLQNSPKLDEAIMQSARYSDLIKQIRMGTIDSEKANVNKNQIRFAILELTREIETTISTDPQIEAEANAYVQNWRWNR